MSDIAIAIYDNFPLYFLALGLIIYISISKIESKTERLFIFLTVITCVVSSICTIISDWLGGYYSYYQEIALKNYPDLATFLLETGTQIKDYSILRNITSATSYLNKGAIVFFLWLLIRKEKEIKTVLLLSIPLMVSFVLYFSSPFTKLIFYFNEENRAFMYGALYYYVWAIPIFYACLIFNEAIKNYIKKNYKELTFIIFLTLCFVSASILETMLSEVKGTYILDETIMTCCVFYYLFLHSSTMLENIEDIELKLVNKDAELKLSQINPHFIFNTLNGIVDVCREGSPEQEALLSFSKYLRVNLDVMSSPYPISFSTELEHISTYVKLEKLRYGENISLKYDIIEDGFFIPALAIQPLVENSIKYGMLKNGKVNIEIKSYCDEKAYYIEVNDDAGGFDEVKAKNDGKHHIGIDNVKYRLRKMMNAKIDIVSIPEQGTNIKIMIPR